MGDRRGDRIKYFLAGVSDFIHSKLGRWILSALGLLVGGALTAIGKDFYETTRAKYHAHFVAISTQTQSNKDTLAPIVMWLVQHDKEQDSARAGWRKRRDSMEKLVVGTKGGSYKGAYDLMKK